MSKNVNKVTDEDQATITEDTNQVEAEEQLKKEQAEKEAAEKEAEEQLKKEQAEKEAAEKEAKEQAEKEAAEKEAKEQAEKEAADKKASEKEKKEAAEKKKAAEKSEAEKIGVDPKVMQMAYKIETRAYAGNGRSRGNSGGKIIATVEQIVKRVIRDGEVVTVQDPASAKKILAVLEKIQYANGIMIRDEQRARGLKRFKTANDLK